MFKESTLDYICKEPDLAFQVVRGLEKEISRLQGIVAHANGYDGRTDLIEEVEEWFLQNQQNNEILRKKIFDRSTEQRKGPDEQQEGQAKPQPSPNAKRKRIKPTNSGRGPVGEDLPLVRENYHLEAGTCCDCSEQVPLSPMNQAEISHLVDFVPGKLIRRQIVRWKYRAPCGCIKTAQGPTTLVDGG